MRSRTTLASDTWDRVGRLLVAVMASEDDDSGGELPLQALVNRRWAELGFGSVRQTANSTGGAISYSTLAQITSGRHPTWELSPDTLQAVADLVHVPLARVRRAAAASSAMHEAPFEVPEAGRLNSANRRGARALILHLLSEQERSETMVAAFRNLIALVQAAESIEDVQALQRVLSAAEAEDGPTASEELPAALRSRVDELVEKAFAEEG